MANVAGIDVGLSFLKRTSGVCRTGRGGSCVDHTFADRQSRLEVLALAEGFEVLAIDGPVLGPQKLHYNKRAVESVFNLGLFQTRCKPGFTHVPGNGQALRRDRNQSGTRSLIISTMPPSRRGSLPESNDPSIGHFWSLGTD